MSQVYLCNSGIEESKKLGLKALDFLGPYKSVKCIAEEDGDFSVLVSCSAQFLQHLSLQHPVSHVIQSALEAHHKQFGCGTATLLAMQGFWSTALSNLFKEGIIVSEIIGDLQELLECCIINIYPEAISIDDIVSRSIINKKQKEKYHIQMFEKSNLVSTLQKQTVNVDLKNVPLMPQKFDSLADDDNDVTWFFTEETINSEVLSIDELLDLDQIQNKYNSKSCSQAKVDDKEFEELMMHCAKDNICPDEDADFYSCFESVCRPEDSKLKDNVGFCHQENVKESTVIKKKVQPKENNFKESDVETLLKEKLSQRIKRDDAVIKLSSRHLRDEQKDSIESSISETDGDPISTSAFISFQSLSSGLDFQLDNRFPFLLESHSNNSCSYKNLENKLIKNIETDLKMERGKCNYFSDFENDWTDGMLHFCQGLNPSDVNLTNVIFKLWVQQVEDNQHFSSPRFTMKSLHCCCIAGLSRGHSCAVKGVVIPASLDMVSAITQASNKKRRALLFNGDLSPSFIHLGFKNTISMTRVMSQVLNETTGDIWLDQVKNQLKELSVDLLLIHGHVDSALVDHCLSVGIIVLEHIPGEILKALSIATNSSVNTYIADCDKFSVACNITVDIWNFEQTSKIHLKNVYHVCITTECLLQTAILCHPSKDFLSVIEDRFWHMVKKLQSCCNSNITFLGSGNMEQLCIKTLRTLQDSCSDSQNVCVLQCLEQGFAQYLQFLQNKLSQCQDMGDENECIMEKMNRCNTYEDFQAKIECWRTALRLACLIAQTDMVIINGLNSNLGQL